MVLTTTEILDEISIIVGDLAEQWTASDAKLKMAYELQNSLIWLTTENVFPWNIREEALTANASGEITPTYSFGKVLQITDSSENYKYEGSTAEEFYLRKRQSDFLASYASNSKIPFIITTSRTTGVEVIQLPTMTPSTWFTSLTFYVLYNEVTGFDGTTAGTIDPWIPTRLRRFLVSLTAANMLVKVENPDKELISAHIDIAKSNLRQELTFSLNRNLNRWNVSMNTSPNLFVRANSSGGAI